LEHNFEEVEKKLEPLVEHEINLIAWYVYKVRYLYFLGVLLGSIWALYMTCHEPYPKICLPTFNIDIHMAKRAREILSSIKGNPIQK
jgi:hypothetical protein